MSTIRRRWAWPGAARALVVALVVIAVLEAGGAIAAGLFGGESFAVAVGSFTVTNLAIAIGFGACGAILAWHRPEHPVGWLLLVSAGAQGATGLAAPLVIVGTARDWPSGLVFTAATVFSWGWPWSMGLGFFLALLLFPDGRLPSRRWRPVAIGITLTGLAFVAMVGMDPASSDIGGLTVTQGGAIADYHRADAVWSVIGLLNVACLLLVLLSLVVRYRRGDEVIRQQLLWLLLAVIAIVVVAVPVVAFPVGSELLLLVIVLVPVAIVISVLRHNLLDIRLVVSRALSWTVLTGALAAAYVLLAGLLGLVLAGTASAVAATALLALALNPLRLRLQRGVDRLFYGDRGDPLRVVGTVGSRLEGSGDLADLAAAIAEALRLPFVAIRSGGRELAACGTAPEVLHSVPLMQRAERIGELVVGARVGSRRLASSDSNVLKLVAAPVSMAVHATLLAEQLQAARTRVVTAREEERRRLRRDLHDGLGSALSGIGFMADAARNYVRPQPEEAIELLTGLRRETASALEDVRRLVYDLRPPVLDDRGLLEALRVQGEHLERSGDAAPLTVTVDGPDPLPRLPAAVEVAAFRIATEALTNVARHSHAASATVVVTVNGSLSVRVVDDGGPTAHAWTPGVGLIGMKERAAELGGTLRAGPGPGGGEVSVTLPLEPGQPPGAGAAP